LFFCGVVPVVGGVECAGELPFGATDVVVCGITADPEHLVVVNTH
jgi:hypothetical protein